MHVINHNKDEKVNKGRINLKYNKPKTELREASSRTGGQTGRQTITGTAAEVEFGFRG